MISSFPLLPPQELPVRKLDKKTLMADKSIAGFQKLSIIHLPGTTAVYMNARHTHKGCPAAGSRGHFMAGDAFYIALSILVFEMG